MPRPTIATVAGPGLTWRRVGLGDAQHDEAIRFLELYDDGYQRSVLDHPEYGMLWTLSRPDGMFNEMTEEQGRDLMAVLMFDTSDYVVTAAVNPPYRRRGLATKMLQYLLRQEVEQVTMRVALRNEAGIAFASRFTPVWTGGSGSASYSVSVWDHFGEEVRCNCGPCVRQLIFTM